MKKIVKFCLFVLLLLAVPTASHAQEMSEGWQYKFGTFIWAPDTNIKVEAPGTTIDANVPFMDLVEYSVPSINLTFQAKKDKLALHANLFNTHLKNDIESSGGTRGVSVDIYIPEVFVGYEVLNTHLTDAVQLAVEPYVGVRYLASRVLIDNVGGGEWRDTSRNATDAIVGILATVGIGEKFSLTLRGDAGGFGLGGESNDKDYFGLAGFNWNYSKNRTVSLGYAYLMVGKDGLGHSGDVDSEVEFKGPILSHTFSF